MTIEVNTDANNNINIDVETTQANASVNLLSSPNPMRSIGTTPLFGPQGPQGEQGEQGPQGEQGEQGEPGNGITTIERTSTSGLIDTYTITYDDGGTTTFDVTNGAQGTPGQDGYSPTATVTETPTGATLTVTDANGTTTANLLNGVDGQDGTAATISVGTVSTGAAGTSATVVNSGTSSAAVLDFVIPQGDKGATGENGQNGISVTGVELLSTSGLQKTYRMSFSDGNHFDYIVQDGASGATSWGSITGTLSNQTDLQNALTDKADKTNRINGAPLSNAATVFFGTSTSAADATQKEVSIPAITTLDTGTVIVVQPTITSTVADSTLKLNGFTAYPMRYNNAAITTSTDSIVWHANYLSAFVFDGTYWQFLCHGLDSNTTYTLNYSIDAGAYVVGTGSYAVTRYSLMLQKADMTWEKPTDPDAKYSTATTKTVNTHGFRLGQIKYYSSTSNFANGAIIGANAVYDKSASVDLRYSTNCGATPAWTAGNYIYLVGTIGADGLFYLDLTTWWTNALPNTNDGKVYVRLGIFISDAKITLLSDHPVFYHDGNGIKEYKVADNKQDLLISGTNIKTINSTSLLGSSDIALANQDLSNLTSTGEKHFLNKQQVSNCIIEAPNGVCSISGRTLTLKEGLKVLIANGLHSDRTLKNIEYSLPADLVLDYSNYGTNQVRTTFLKSDGTTISAYIGYNLGYYKYLSYLPSTVENTNAYYAFAAVENRWYTTSGSTTANWSAIDIIPIVDVNFDTAITMGIRERRPIKLVDSDMADGQWVDSQSTIATGVNAPTSTNIEYSLSTYLPNDDYTYEVIFSMQGGTAASANSYQYGFLRTDIINTGTVRMYVARVAQGANNSVRGAGTATLPVGAGRKVIVVAESTNTGTFNLYVLGYRRIGNNG